MKLLMLLLALNSAFAEESLTKPAVKDESVETAEAINDESATKRAAGSAQVLLDYSSIDLIIPNKWGATATWLDGPDSSLEFEYLTGALNFPFLVDELGEIRDSRFSLIRRNYAEKGNFNFFYGLAYHKFHVKVGSEILNRIGNVPFIDVMEFDTLAVVLGLGHRWVFDHNITLGIDWISLSQPVVRTRRNIPIMQYVRNSSDRSDLDTVIRFGEFFPRIVLLKLQAGFTF
jgi:hypothetical protein